jgi:hypothetical protein
MITILVLSSLGPGAAAGALDDATILAIFDQANTADIVTGRLGAKYGASEEFERWAKWWPPIMLPYSKWAGISRRSSS